MTCIAAYSDGLSVVMGADSMAHNGKTATQRRTPKVFARNGVLFGACGKSRFSQILHYELDVPEPPATGDAVERWAVVTLVPALREACKKAEYLKKDDGDLFVMEGNILVATRGRILRLFNNFEATENSVPYDAEGSGDETALGVMHALHYHSTETPRAVVEAALRAAEFHTPHVRGPFHYVEEASVS